MRGRTNRKKKRGEHREREGGRQKIKREEKGKHRKEN
jgi:hypothetical protein